MTIYPAPECVLAEPSEWVELAPGCWGKKIPDTVERKPPKWVTEQLALIDEEQHAEAKKPSVMT